MRLFVVAFVSLAILLGAPVSRAAEEPEQPWQGTIGVRAGLIKGAGFDPFSERDGFTQLSLGVSRVFLRRGPWSLAARAGWDTGSTQAYARGAEGHLSLNRLSAALELRRQVASRVYAFGRLAPGVLWGTADLRQAVSVVPLETRFTALSVDASGGVAARLSDARSRYGIWLVADGGYGWTPTQSLSLGPSFSGADSDKAGTISLQALAARGPFGRGSLAVTY